MKFKKVVPLLVLILSLGFSSPSFANGSITPESTSENQLDKILLEYGVPEDVLSTYDYYKKEMIVKDNPEGLKYGTTVTTTYAVDDQTGQLIEIDPSSPVLFDNISNKDLRLSLDHFETNINGQNMDRVYASFEWLNPPKGSPAGIYKDVIAIAVPNGWQIQDGRYSGAIQYRNWISNLPWSTPYSNGVGYSGDPIVQEIYGAGWDFSSSTYHGHVNDLYKGTVGLVMKNTNGGLRRVSMRYGQANSSVLGNYSVSFAWGPTSVSFNASSGSVDEATLAVNF